MTIKRRQSREETSSKLTDECIAPYVIYFDGFTYTLVKPKENGLDENVGFYGNLPGALKSAAKLIVNEERTTTIKDFILKYDEVINKLNEKFDI